MNRLGHHSQPQQQAVASSSSAMDNDSIGSAQPANIYNLNLRDSTHVAYDHEDTTQGAIHSFQDEFGNWWTYSFDDQSVGTAQALGSSRAIYEMFNRRRSSGNNSSSSTQKHGSNARRRLTVPNANPQAPDEASTSSSVMLKLGTGKESAGTPATITLNTIEAAQEQEEMLPSTSQQPTAVNIVVDPKRDASHVQSRHHRRHSSSTSSSSEGGEVHSSRYISNAPTSIFHPMGGVPQRLDIAGIRVTQQEVQWWSSVSKSALQPIQQYTSALALVAAGSSTNQQGFNVLAGSRSSVGGRFDSNTAASNFHNFEQLRRLANDPSYGRHPPDVGDTLMTIDGAAALPVHHPTAAQTSSLTSVTQSVRIFNDLQARGAATAGIGGGHSAKAISNLYIGEGWKVKLDRLSVGALFDRNNFFMSGMVDVLLATLVSLLAAAIIFKNVYADFSLMVFAFVVAGSQFSLLKSVQPDAASPVHGYNWLVAYSRPAYFCLFQSSYCCTT
uniref:Pecanex-like protein n=1 Tax=Ditylenchus dipsaci TaxID=166011 RepID=A0A915DT84_9BILA